MSNVSPREHIATAFRAAALIVRQTSPYSLAPLARTQAEMTAMYPNEERFISALMVLHRYIDRDSTTLTFVLCRVTPAGHRYYKVLVPDRAPNGGLQVVDITRYLHLALGVGIETGNYPAIHTNGNQYDVTQHLSQLLYGDMHALACTLE